MAGATVGGIFGYIYESDKARSAKAASIQDSARAKRDAVLLAEARKNKEELIAIKLRESENTQSFANYKKETQTQMAEANERHKAFVEQSRADHQELVDLIKNKNPSSSSSILQSADTAQNSSMTDFSM